MFLRRASHRTAARLSAATQPQVCALLEPLENRRLLSAVIKGSEGVMLESTGKPVALDYDANNNVVLERFDANGYTLDPTFGVGGQVATSIPAFNGRVPADIAIGPGDRLVVGGNQTVAIFNGNGAADPSFGSGGTVTLPPGETVNAVGVQPDGKVVVAKTLTLGNASQVQIVQRFNADGSPDTLFGTGSTVALPLGASIADLVVESNGDIAAVGTGKTGDPYIAQVRPNGALYWQEDGSPGTGSYNAVTEAPDGTLVAVGDVIDSAHVLLMSLVSRYLPDGTIIYQDVGGDMGGQATLEGVAVTNDGKILVAGSEGLGATSLFAERYDLHGQFDPTFNDGAGITHLTSGLGANYGRVAVAADGSSYVAGTAFFFAHPGDAQADSVPLLYHLSPSGSTAPDAAGTHEAEDYDQGGEGVGYHDTDSANLGGAYRPSEGVDIQAGGTGYNVGWTHAGEWLQYTVNAPVAGAYSMSLSMANVGTGATFHVELDGKTVDFLVHPPIAVPDTGDFQSYTSVWAGWLGLSVGQHTIRIVFDSNSQYGYAGNVDNFTLGFMPPDFADGTPYNGTSFKAGDVVEAENFNGGVEGEAYHDTDPQNLGGQYRPGDGVDIENTGDVGGGGYDVGWTHTGEWMNYFGDVDTAGGYDFVARVANVGSGGTFHVSVDGEDVSGPIAIPDTGGFQNYTTVTAKLYAPLTAGEHIFRITFDGQSQYGFSGNLNWFQLQPSAAPAPQPFGPTPITLAGIVQAENYDQGGEGVAYHDTDSANLGGAYRPSEGVDIEAGGTGYAVDYTHAGEWLNYSVDLAQTGTYAFQAMVSNAESGGAFHVTVDGIDVTGELTVPDTGSWQTYEAVDPAGIHLTAGRHVVRVYWDANNANGFSGNMDYFAFI